MQTDDANSKCSAAGPARAGRPRWLNGTVLGIGLASLFSDWSHEIATTVMPAFLATMGVAAAWLGIIEGVSDGLSSFAKMASGYYTDKLPRRNDTHQSSTDPESVLYRKAKGKEAKLCFGGQILMENRNGLCADFTIHDPIAEPELVVALRQIQAHQELHPGVQVKTLGTDKAYQRKDFVVACREQGIAPHVACKEGVSVPRLDGRTTTKESYRFSQRIRKRVEEIFAWIQTVGGLRCSRYRGRERTQAWGYFVVAAYNLLRLARLSLAAAR